MAHYLARRLLQAIPILIVEPCIGLINADHALILILPLGQYKWIASNKCGNIPGIPA
jgi:hypothetical protein